jgi:hypothetical protein
MSGFSSAGSSKPSEALAMLLRRGISLVFEGFLGKLHLHAQDDAEDAGRSGPTKS